MQLKLFLLYFFIISCSFNAFSQGSVLELLPEVEQVIISEDDSDNASLFLDAGSFLMPVQDIYTTGLSLTLGGTTKCFASGLAFDFIATKKVFLPSEYEVVSPSYTSVFFGWGYEYICNPQKRLNISLAIKSGFGYSEYLDNAASGEVYYYETNDSSSYYTPVYYYSSGLIVSNTSFSIQPGINVLCNLTDWLAVGAGFNSRIVFAITEESPLRDDGYYSGRFFLRFTMK